jgi:serine protease
LVRQEDSGWLVEGVAFAAEMPVNATCPSDAPVPVYRLYNNRWMFNDSNHRYVTRPDLYQQMIAKGWIGEGVAMCVIPSQ